jgi:hypothetical protein
MRHKTDHDTLVARPPLAMGQALKTSWPSVNLEPGAMS